MDVHRVIIVFALLWASGSADQQEETAVTGTTNPAPVATDAVDANQDTQGLEKNMNMGVGGYQTIANFVVTHGARKAKVRSRVDCENVCDQREDCKSFSYRPGDKRCLWSTYALKFDSKFSFNMKLTKMDDTGQMKPTGDYKRFNNFGFHEPGWRKLVTDQAGCQDLCNKIDKCGAYSYRDYDQLCMMSGDGVKFDTDFNYYERNMPEKPNEEETELLSGKDEKEADVQASAESIKDDTLSKAAEVLTAKAHAARKVIEKATAELHNNKNIDGEDLDAKEDQMRVEMKKAEHEKMEKLESVKRIEKLRSETGNVLALKAKSMSKETEEKARDQIQNAFQEGYEKAQTKNRNYYEEQVQEIAQKETESAKEHVEKVKKVATKMKKEQAEKEKAEAKQKENDHKAMKKELKGKAVQEVRVNSLKKFAADQLEHQALRDQNEDKLKRILVIAEKRREREKTYKEAKLKKINEEDNKMHEKKIQDAKERKEKVNHESEVKDEERRNIEFANKRKEESHKEIEKKEQVHRRQLQIEEVNAKLERAKKDAAALNEKHMENEAKIGKCEEVRVKGQFITYAYATSAVFVNAMAPSETYGAQAEYNGMLRIQNGLGNKVQRAYAKFSANGNKIVDESAEVMLGESSSSREPVVPDASENVVEDAKSREVIEKSKVEYVARRRWVDRRRRWSVEPIVSDRRRDVLASRRRELSERRRRSISELETSVTKAVLKVFKFGGPAAQLQVRASNCEWERTTLDFTKSSKLSTPESLWRRMLRSQSLIEVTEGAVAEIGAQDSSQMGYWSRRRQQSTLGDSGTTSNEPDVSPATLPIPVPYVPDRRRYVDRRRRFPTPEPEPGQGDPSAPPPTTARRRFVGQTAGTVFVPEAENVWLTIPLSSDIVGVMRSVDKLCFEITGGGPEQPVILGSELSTNKPYLQLDVAGQSGARRRRCNLEVALQNSETAPPPPPPPAAAAAAAAPPPASAGAPPPPPPPPDAAAAAAVAPPPPPDADAAAAAGAPPPASADADANP